MLPERMSIEQLEQEIKREPTEFKKMILKRKLLKLPSREWLERNDRSRNV